MTSSLSLALIDMLQTFDLHEDVQPRAGKPRPRRNSIKLPNRTITFCFVEVDRVFPDKAAMVV